MSTNTGTQNLPGHSRVWIYQANRELNPEEKQEISSVLEDFIANWAAHGAPLLAGYDLIHDRFIVLAVDEKQAAASGCSIDSSVRVFKALDEQLKLDLFNRLSLAFRGPEGHISTLAMADFEKELKTGSLNEETIVFNNLVTNLEEFRSSWETPVKGSWHARLVP